MLSNYSTSCMAVSKSYGDIIGKVLLHGFRCTALFRKYSEIKRVRLNIQVLYVIRQVTRRGTGRNAIIL